MGVKPEKKTAGRREYVCALRGFIYVRDHLGVLKLNPFTDLIERVAIVFLFSALMRKGIVTMTYVHIYKNNYRFYK